MSTSTMGQVLCGPFNEKDLPSYQAGLLHIEGQWWDFLSRNQLRLVLCIFNRSIRFGRQWAYIPKRWFFDGHDQNEDGGYAGQNPILPQSDTNYNRLLRELADCGVMQRKGNRYRLNFSINAVDLATREDVQKRLQKEHARGGILKTVEGIIQWATQLTSRYLNPDQRPSPAPSTNKTPTALKRSATARAEYPHLHGEKTRAETSLTNTQTNKRSKNTTQAEPIQDLTSDKSDTYTCHYKNYVLFPNKSGNKCLGDLELRTPDEILASVSASVKEKSDKVRAKRKKRRNLSDLAAMFEEQWAKGQRDSGSSVPANRIVHADRGLLKTQLLKRSQGTALDTDAFAYWVAKNWQAIGAQHFPKAKSYPERPAIRWMVKCLETYMVAWEQREHLDEDGTVSKTEMMHKAKRVDQVTDAAKVVASDDAARIAELESLLAERDEMISEFEKDKTVGNDMLSDDELAMLRKGRKLTLPDYDDEPAPRKPRRRKLRKTR